MKLTRAALTVAATALAPTPLLATPAFAGDSAAATIGVATASTATDGADPSVGDMTDHDVRVAILRIIDDPETGKAVRAAAQAAMNGTIADQRHFLETGRAAAQFEDDRVAVFRILADPNVKPAVKAAAERALAADTPEALRYFLERGQHEV
ncbi:hypothetical protein ACH4E8_06505 [Streptomyces sp. NPDC017979]|uniref:hypothetical protein n=1 Tax=Streptomyces sp. NPDC017979 TaxID=3365024 RepID=UPI00378D0899